MGCKIIQAAVLAAFYLTLSSGALLGVQQCSYGPSYWCDSLQNAKECNAVKHCIQTVWERKVLPEDNDDICTLCKDMVKQARDTLLSNETQEEIREVFDGSCRLIPVKLVQDECIHLANDFIPELIDTLASQMNPQMVCATAGLCNSVRVDELLLEYKKLHPEKESNAIVHKEEAPHPEPGDCDDCKAFVRDTIRLVKTHSKTELLDRLFAICGRLGSLSDGCMALMQMNFDGIYNYLTQELQPDDFCDLVGMCERMYENRKTAVDFHRSKDAPCDFCTVIVQHWKDVLTANTTELEFKEILEGLCHQTGKFKQECLGLVDQYYLPLYNLLVSDIHPKEICEAVGLCGLDSVFGETEHPVWVLFNPGPVIVKKTVPFTRLKPAIRKNIKPGHLIGTDEAAAVHATEHNAPSSLPRVKLTQTGVNVAPVGTSGFVGPAITESSSKDNNKCVMCEFALNFLQNILEQKDTREDIEHAVENLCSYMPKTISEECEDYVEAYGDQVIEFLDQEIDPSKICTMLHLCPAALEGKVEDDVSCVMCEYAMTQLEDVLKDNKTEASIRHAMENLCSVLPRTIVRECDMFVDEYTDQVIEMLIQDFSPDQICIQLKLCKPKKAPLQPLDSRHQLPIIRLGIPALNLDVAAEPPKEMPTKQSSICIVCEFAMTQLDQMLTDNATEDEIMRGVEFVCTKLPRTIQDDCIGFVEEYGDAIIKLLINELAPEAVCTQIGLCEAVELHMPVAVVDTEVDKCDLCERVFDYINEILKSGGATRPIEDAIEKVCLVLPEKERPYCLSLIEVYGPYLVDMLTELGDGKSVCQAISVCPKEDGKRLLGGKRCTWGPAYWCQTKIHAKACKAESHCEEVVWKGKAPAV